MFDVDIFHNMIPSEFPVKKNQEILMYINKVAFLSFLWFLTITTLLSKIDYDNDQKELLVCWYQIMLVNKHVVVKIA